MRRPVTDPDSSYLSKEQTYKFSICCECCDCQQMAKVIPSQEHELDIGLILSCNGAVTCNGGATTLFAMSSSYKIQFEGPTLGFDTQSDSFFC